MPLGLRANRSTKDLHRRSTLDPFSSRRSEQVLPAHASVDNLAPSRGVVSHDESRPPLLETAFEDVDSQGRPPSPPVQPHTPMTRRFSLMRFRHASDSQLAARAKQQAAEQPPPVPDVPAAPLAPAIIMTAPTIDETQPPPKKRSKFQPFARRRLSFDPTILEEKRSRVSTDKRDGEGKRNGFGSWRIPRISQDEPGRLSVTHPRDAPSDRDSGSRTSLALPVPRHSDSSRSDGTNGTNGTNGTGSTGDHVTFASIPEKTRPQPSSTRSSFFRRNKQKRASLFPLPVRIPPPQNRNTAPSTPRASTSALSAASVDNSPDTYSLPFTAIHDGSSASAPNGVENGDTPPLPSPTHLNPTPPGIAFSASGAVLLRNDSQLSAKSTPALAPPVRMSLRGRSSTMGSTGAQSDDGPPPTPPFLGSGRTSTSTAGRSSLSTLFGLSHRFRQQSDPHSPRHGSPNHAQPGTPGLTSHSNSLNISRETLVLPEREEGEQPSRYLERLEGIVLERGLIPGLMCKSDDSFSLAVLRSYMRKFAFFGDPLDMALRKLLMEAKLPTEGQQISRFLEKFADRYHECNPGIFPSPEEAFFVSYSLMILHTDFFNKNNKRKMQRPDYVKNTISGTKVSEDVLKYFYDNIVYTPFIRFEDEIDLKDTVARRNKKTLFKSNSIDQSKKVPREPIDPYSLILESKLDYLRPPIRDVMYLDDPYNYVAAGQSLDFRQFQSAFARYGVLQIVSARSRPEAFMSPATIDNPDEAQAGVVEMPVTKVGILWRKDTKKKTARSPWQKWGAILTRSGLSLFKNAGWVESLIHQYESHHKHAHSGSPVVFKPPLQDFKPDHSLPTDGAVALIDSNYRKHKHAFIVFAKGGFEEVFLADDDTDVSDWLGRLNYSAAFETYGVRSRGLVGGLYDGQRSRGIRHLESSHSGKSVTTPTGEVTIHSGRIDMQLAQEIATMRRETTQRKIGEIEERLEGSVKDLNNKLRDARHLQILSPVHPKTRELVVHAAGHIAAQLRWKRIEIWRMKCHRDILAKDLEDERRVASDKQALSQPVGPTSAASPTTSKTAKASGLARLNSKASTILSGSKSPNQQSPSLSLRPGTKGSKETDLGEEAFKAGPEHSKQSSPAAPHISLEFPPLGMPDWEHRSSITSYTTQSTRPEMRSHRPSVSTMGDQVSEGGSRHVFRPADEREGDGLSQHTDGRPGTASSESDAERLPHGSPGSHESRSRVRRSLHRTLRDSTHTISGHRRGKGKDSTSSAGMDDANGAPESEGLARGKGSFTVHGKKASVITFGSDWRDLTAEERLKLRKQAQDEEGKISVPNAIEDEPEPPETAVEDKRASTASESTAIAHSPRAEPPKLSKHPASADKAPAPFSDPFVESRSRRNSVQTTIGPQSPQSPFFQSCRSETETPVDGYRTPPEETVLEKAAMDSAIEEEAENGRDRGLEGPKPQAVKA